MVSAGGCTLAEYKPNMSSATINPQAPGVANIDFVNV
jgi:hypothetical protein